MGVSKLIGRLFGGDAKNEAVLRAYGKLPMYAEYRRLEVSPGTPTLFSQWMDAGRLAWVRSPTKSDAARMRTSRLMFRLPESRDVIVANVWESRDSLGRSFPFAFFIVCPLEALGADPFERSVSATALHEAFDRLHAELGALGSGGNFYRLYQKRVMPIRPDDISEQADRLKQEAREIPAKAWFRSAFGDETCELADWIGEMRRRLGRWGEQPALMSELALSCPLSDHYPLTAQIALWLSWIDGVLRSAGRPVWVITPSPKVSGPRSLTLIVRDVLSDDFQLLTTDESDYDFIENLSAAPAAADASESDVPLARTPAESSLLDCLSAPGA